MHRRTIQEQLDDCKARGIVSFVLHPPPMGTKGLTPRAALDPPRSDYRFEVPETETVGQLQERVAVKWRGMFKASHRPTGEQIELTPRGIGRADLDRWRHPERPLTGDLGGPQLELENNRLNTELDVDVLPPRAAQSTEAAAGGAAAGGARAGDSAAAGGSGSGSGGADVGKVAGPGAAGSGTGGGAAAAGGSGASSSSLGGGKGGVFDGDSGGGVEDGGDGGTGGGSAGGEGMVDDGTASDDAPVDPSQLDLPDADRPPPSIRTMGELREWMQKHQVALGF